MSSRSTSFALFAVLGVVGAIAVVPASAQVVTTTPRIDFRNLHVDLTSDRPVLARAVASDATASRSRSAQERAGAARAPEGGSWEFEVHGGFGSGSNPSGGTSRMPAPGTFFILADGLTASRLVSSWYFGDGASLFNAVAAARGLAPAARVIPLDLALSSQTIGRQAGGHAGLRFGRPFNSRITWEFQFDYGFNHMAFTKDATSSIEQSRNSFGTAITGMNNSSGTLLPNPTISSTATLSDHRGSQLMMMGAVTIGFRSDGAKNGPYVIFGEGVTQDYGKNPSARLVGDYTLTSSGVGGLQFHQTDTVTLHNSSDPALVFMMGLGMRKELNANSGMRFEVRFNVTQNTMNAMVDAQPQVSFGTPTAVSILNATNPGLQFSNTAAAKTSLSGSPITNFVAFEGKGIRAQAGVSIGYFRRF